VHTQKNLSERRKKVARMQLMQNIFSYVLKKKNERQQVKGRKGFLPPFAIENSFEQWNSLLFQKAIVAEKSFL
jgi:hypothetical protein